MPPRVHKTTVKLKAMVHKKTKKNCRGNYELPFTGLVLFTFMLCGECSAVGRHLSSV